MIKVKIIKTPVFHPFSASTRRQAPFFPPLAMARITGFLESKGFDINQQDLNVELQEELFHSRAKINTTPLLDFESVKMYLKGDTNYLLENTSKTINEKVEIKKGTEFVLLSIEPWFLAPITTAMLIMENIRKEHPKAKIILGGSETLSDLFETIYQLGLADYLIQNNGEKEIYKLILAIKNNTNLSKVRGLSYFKNKKIVNNKEGRFEVPARPSFDSLNLENYSWTPNKYFKHPLLKKKTKKKIIIIPYQFIAGCPYKCRFCTMSGYSNFAAKKPTDVVEDLKYLSRRYNTKYFYFLNSTINISKQYIKELCQEIIAAKLDILWTDCGRFDNLDEEIISLMKKAGCIRMIFGLETGSQKLLTLIDKRVDIKKIPEVLKVMNDNNIWIGLEIIAGLPSEKESDIKTTTNFLETNSNLIDTTFFTPFYLAKNSLFLKEPEKYGLTNVEHTRTIQKTNIASSIESFAEFSFDEINGLKWNEKKKQIDKSLIKVRYSCSAKESIMIYESIPFLFYLYSNFKDKKTIEKIYFDVKKSMNRKYFLKPTNIIKQLISIKSVGELKKKVKSLI